MDAYDEQVSACQSRFWRVFWLFSPREDLLAFAVPALFAIVTAFYLEARSWLFESIEPFFWLFCVVLIDVAHVYATMYRVYAHPAELRRRWQLYLAVPLATYAASVALYVHSELLFWRVLAYVAVFHFIRQQYGWIALCGRKEGLSVFDRRLDALAVYAGTLYPLFYWHTHLPRRFAWFLAGDFLFPAPLAHFAPWLDRLLGAAWVVVGAIWSLRQLQRLLGTGHLPITRLLIMISTWTTWYLGIVYFNSDVAFTITNVLPHGLPYFVLLYRYHVSKRNDSRSASKQPWRFTVPYAALGLFYLPLVLLAFAEEGVWDRLVWHEHGMLFPGPAMFVSKLSLCFLVPLLALPQATHYLLDAWIWKVGPKNPDLRRHLRL